VNLSRGHVKDMAERHRNVWGLLCGGLIVAGCLGLGAARAVDHPDLFRAWSPDFADNGFLSADNAFSGSSPRGPWQCGGENIPPALSWSEAPADTKSFAVVMDDPDAAMGRGGNHWIIYDIPPNAAGIARGAAVSGDTFVGGDSGIDKLAYHGPCAEPGAKPHHFLFMVYALDIPLGTLPPGLTKAEFIKRIQGHNLAEASVSARYQRARDGAAMQPKD
jgi:Raf kinase inhibitor-like YbhB/YbcL family protein